MEPTLTLCLIARDEAEFLPGCLASVEGLVDQVVVVDTGSADDTVALAEAAGATVVHHPWQDDFAAARNAALPHTTGDWILVLDADERLADWGREAVRAAIREGGFALGLLPLSDATRLDATPEQVLDGSARKGDPVHLPRLLKRTPDLAWEGIVHESVAAWLVRHGGRTRFVDAPIVHFGAVPEVRARRAKAARNLALLERLCAENPDAPVPFAYLASERARADDLVGAREAADRGWKAMARAIGATRARPSVTSLATIRAQLELAGQDPSAALATVAQARAWSNEHPNYGFLAAQALVSLGRFEEALTEVERALAGADGRWLEPVLDGALGWRSRTLRASLLGRLSRFAEAEAEWDRVLAERPDDDVARLARIELLLDAGHAERALTAVEPLLPTNSADAWTLAALAANALGDHAAALTLAARGTEAAWLEPARRRRMAELHAELSFRQGQARAGLGPWGTLGALLSHKPAPEPCLVPDRVLEQVLDSLIRRGRGEDVELLVGPRADALGDRVPERVHAWLAGHGLDWTPPDEPDFVFVGGAGRSGTTLFRAMLSAHPRLWCGPERKLVPAFAEWHQRFGQGAAADLREAGVEADALDEAARAWLTTFLRAGTPPGRRIAEKTPHNLLHTALLGRLFPRAKFVHVLRDGHAVAESLVRQRWLDATTGRPLPWCADLPSAATYWASVVNEIRRQAPSVPGRFLEVRYEDLVASPRATMERVLAFLDEPWDEAVLHHDRAPGVKLSGRESSSAAVGGALDRGRLDAWRARLDDHDLALIRAAAGPVLDATGYATPAPAPDQREAHAG